MGKTTQAKLILEWLESGRTLTPIDALQNFGCFRLAARIKDLRDAGHNIIDTREGSGHSVYTMAATRELTTDGR